eukprot:tig00021072_g17995.t1
MPKDRELQKQRRELERLAKSGAPHAEQRPARPKARDAETFNPYTGGAKRAAAGTIDLESKLAESIEPLQRSEVVENKLYVGNLDARITEYAVLKLFRTYGKIVREEFLWHQHGQKKGEPRGYCFIEFSSRAEAERAKDALHGKLLLGRPLAVRFFNENVPAGADEDSGGEAAASSSAAAPQAPKAPRAERRGGGMSATEAKIAQLKAKLAEMEREEQGDARPPPASVPSLAGTRVSGSGGGGGSSSRK